MSKKCATEILTMGSDEIQKILYKAKVIAVVGMSRDPSKLAHIIPKYLLEHGYQIIPINPNAKEILGLKSYSSLEDVPDNIKIDILEIFRPPEEIPALVEVAHKKRIPVVWLQVGLRSKEAAEKAAKYGIIFVENLCIRREHMLMMGTFF
ncbi:MAG: CoA-binding protein [Candidatus Odinarchaeum yellowstonii]|uniref:CoA-binding protein n=1 Tax=Odinarchaeota yellowstonii (strain LCB_4) TaxID=1841599 RepID=A0AAF0D2V7_ODILC|nr:MAG: CoA-binding protein [Candidatus Odinarchaeum yellowstonii]